MKMNASIALKLNRQHARKRLIYAVVFMLLATIVYYLPVIVGIFNLTALQNGLNNLHNLYGIDFLGLVYFVPVVYVAFNFGVRYAIITSLVSMIMLTPHALLIDNYPYAMFKPTAFALILSAVGSVIALVQGSEKEHRQRMKEMKCLYTIGKEADECSSIEHFLTNIVKIIPEAMLVPAETRIKIKYGEGVYKSPDFYHLPNHIKEPLIANTETIGAIEIYSYRGNPYLDKKNHLAKTLAERISGAIRQIELEQALQKYYSHLEEEVEARTKDLAQVQEKLIRAERLAAVGELASGVGHELRNPLNVIRNCAYLLEMSLGDKLESDTKDTLKVLDKQIDAANKIVTDLLDFTRIKPPSQCKVILKDLLDESISYIERPDNIKLTSRLNGNDFSLHTDPDQLNRVFTNIMTNAIQAMKESGGELTIDAEEQNENVVIRFSDTGCGIPPENLEKIFEPLFTTKPKGIGLGLAITKRLIEQNGGNISVTSEMNKGTTFTITLPLDRRNHSYAR